MKTVYYFFESLRPRQWIKNGFVLIPLIFAQKVFHYPSLLRSLSAVAVFCLLTGAIYLINDLVDIEADCKHPEKRHRPLAAGVFSPLTAKAGAAVFLLSSIILGVYLSWEFFLVLITYLLIQILYNYRLKEMVILDIFSISAGFFLRVIGGAVVIQVRISHWLIICSILISMFLALAKRRHEIVLLGEEEARNNRMIYSHYSPHLLDQMIGVITASTILSYMLYCVSSETIEKFQTDHMIYTFPFVLYGIFRYLYLIHKKNRGGSPEKVLLSDLPLLLSVILWALFCMLIIYGVI